MRNEVLKIVTALFLLLGAATAAQATEASFGQPKWQGDRLDWCVNWSSGCGKAAADAYCKTRGFVNATQFGKAENIGASQATRLIGTGAVCDQAMCDGFSYITCFKPAPATVLMSSPMWNGDRLDWCQNWSQGCGKSAADAFCKAKGYQNSVKFAMAADIGGIQRTRLISTGAVCDQNFCDGFKYIECMK